METSAKSSINVEEAFFTLARDIKAKMDRKLVRNLNTFFQCILFLENNTITLNLHYTVY